MRVVHDLGALLFFVTGVVYIVIQTYISCKAYPFGHVSKAMCWTRAGIASIASLALLPSILFSSNNWTFFCVCLCQVSWETFILTLLTHFGCKPLTAQRWWKLQDKMAAAVSYFHLTSVMHVNEAKISNFLYRRGSCMSTYFKLIIK